jgi:hypothetical protein
MRDGDSLLFDLIPPTPVREQQHGRTGGSPDTRWRPRSLMSVFTSRWVAGM